MTSSRNTDTWQLSFNAIHRTLTHPFLRYRLQCQISLHQPLLSAIAPLQTFQLIISRFYKQPLEAGTYRGLFSIRLCYAGLDIADTITNRMLCNLLSNWKNLRWLYSYLCVYRIPIASVLMLPFLRTTLARVVESPHIGISMKDLYQQISNEAHSHYHYSPKLVLIYFICKLSQNSIYCYLNKNLNLLETEDKSEPAILMNQFLRHLIISFLSDVITYPLESLLVRYSLKGIDLVIDNVSTTSNSIGTVTSSLLEKLGVSGFIRQKEGVLGLYKGFTSVVWDYAIPIAILMIVRYYYTHYNQQKTQETQH